MFFSLGTKSGTKGVVSFGAYKREGAAMVQDVLRLFCLLRLLRLLRIPPHAHAF